MIIVVHKLRTWSGKNIILPSHSEDVCITDNTCHRKANIQGKFYFLMFILCISNNWWLKCEDLRESYYPITQNTYNSHKYTLSRNYAFVSKDFLSVTSTLVELYYTWKTPIFHWQHWDKKLKSVLCISGLLHTTTVVCPKIYYNIQW